MVLSGMQLRTTTDEEPAVQQTGRTRRHCCCNNYLHQSSSPPYTQPFTPSPSHSQHAWQARTSCFVTHALAARLAAARAAAAPASMQQLQCRRPACGMQLRCRRQAACGRMLPPPAARRRARAVAVTASASPFKVQLLNPVANVADADARPLLVFLPGTDGTGQAITPQIPGLVAAGYDIRTLYLPPDDRSGWEQLQAQVLYLLSATLASRARSAAAASPAAAAAAAAAAAGSQQQVLLVAESFGGCLALRLAAAAPQLVRAMVLLNPATSYNASLSGLSSFVASTNLLGLFPQQLYNTAQAVLLPFLVDVERVGAEGERALRSMILMEKPPDFETSPSPVLSTYDDAEGDSTPVTLAAERRRLQANSSAAFTTAGPQLPGSRPGSPTPGGGRGRGGASAAAAGLGGGSVFAPAAAANFRANLMRSVNLPEATLRQIKVPTLLLSSARDRMLPSLAEGARLARLLPNSRRVILPDSGHAALLERGLDLPAIMRGSGISPGAVGPTLTAATAAAVTGGRASSAVKKPVLLNVVPDSSGAQPPGSISSDGTVTPRPATLFPPEAPPAAAPAAAGTAHSSSSGSSSSATKPPAEAAAEAVPVVAAAAATAGAAANVAAGGVSSSGSGGGSDGSAAEPSPPDDLAWDEWSQYLAPWRDLVSPVMLGQEHLAELVGSNRALLFVGNHQKMGLYDTPLLAYELYMRGFKVKGLAHPGHWRGPVGPFFEKFGAVKASPMAAYKLLKDGEQVLLFPGGAREVNKRVDEEYTLLWSDKTDFVRLAARCKAIIVPVVAVGADDAYDVMMEASEVLQAPLLGDLVKGLLARVDPSLDPAEAAMPLTRLPGVGLPTPVPVPNLQRLYFKVCEPIDTAQLGLDVKRDAEGWQQLYNGIKDTITSGMQELLELRATDGQRNVGARVRKAIDAFRPVMSMAQQPGDALGGDAAGRPSRSSNSGADGGESLR